MDYLSLFQLKDWYQQTSMMSLSEMPCKRGLFVTVNWRCQNCRYNLNTWATVDLCRIIRPRIIRLTIHSMRKHKGLTWSYLIDESRRGREERYNELARRLEDSLSSCPLGCRTGPHANCIPAPGPPAVSGEEVLLPIPMTNRNSTLGLICSCVSLRVQFTASPPLGTISFTIGRVFVDPFHATTPRQFLRLDVMSAARFLMPTLWSHVFEFLPHS